MKNLSQNIENKSFAILFQISVFSVFVMSQVSFFACSNRANNSGSPFVNGQPIVQQQQQFPGQQFPNNNLPQTNFPNDLQNCRVGAGQFLIGNQCVTANSLPEACIRGNGVMVGNLCKISRQTQQTFALNLQFGMQVNQYSIMSPFSGLSFNQNSASSAIVNVKYYPRRRDAGTRLRNASQFSIDLLVDGASVDRVSKSFDEDSNYLDLLRSQTSNLPRSTPSTGDSSIVLPTNITPSSTESTILCPGIYDSSSDSDVIYRRRTTRIVYYDLIDPSTGCFPQPDNTTKNKTSSNDGYWVPIYVQLRANVSDMSLLSLQVTANRSYRFNASVSMARCTDGFQSQICPDTIPQPIPLLNL